jgi:hypothetical protein
MTDARPMRVLTTEGVMDLDLRDPDDRSIAGSHWNVVTHFLGSPDTADLGRFKGLTVAGFELETDPDVIEIREGEGDLDIETIYPGR